MARNHVTRIFDVLEQQGRSVSWFADQMGMSRSMVYKINWGERSLTEEFVQRAASILQVPADMLVFLPSELRYRNDQVQTCNDERVPA